MKTLIAIFFSIGLAQHPHVLASEPAPDFLDLTFEKLQESCRHKQQKIECFALIETLRSNERYSDVKTQTYLSQWLMVIASVHPEALNIAYDIAKGLAESHPSISDYLELQISIRYRQDPIAGISAAKKNNLPGTLAMLLKDYLKNGLIQHDIISFSIENFELKLEQGKSIDWILSSARMALDALAKYGDATEIATFVTTARNDIPWQIWRKGEWAKAAATSDYDPKLAWNMLLTYCGSVMLTLDDGVFCEDTAVLINKRATQTVLDDTKFKHVLQLTIIKIESQQPPKIGNALQILQQLAGAGQ